MINSPMTLIIASSTLIGTAAFRLWDIFIRMLLIDSMSQIERTKEYFILLRQDPAAVPQASQLTTVSLLPSRLLYTRKYVAFQHCQPIVII